MVSEYEKIKAHKVFIIVGNKAKGRISKQVLQENKARQIFGRTNISYCLIRTKFGVSCFLETPILRFASFPYYRGYMESSYLIKYPL